jgi:desampylase
MARILHLGDELAARILLAAVHAYPNECCGLIEGIDTADGWRAIAIHEAGNVAQNPARRFQIDPQAQLDLMRKLRGTGRRIVGCFHSHPDGEAKPSATDRAEASESGFVYLIAAGLPDAGMTLAGFVFEDATGFTEIALP